MIRPFGGRFDWRVLAAGFALACLVWTAVLTLVSQGPDAASSQRAEPELPPPSVLLGLQRLRLASQHECVRDTVATRVAVPDLPDGYRPVLTHLTRQVREPEAGTVLARVAGQPLVLIISAGTLYRDLIVGDEGSDILAFEEAASGFGIGDAPDSRMDAALVRAWNSRFSPDGPADRIMLSNLVISNRPPDRVAATATVGETLKPDAVVLEIQSRDKTFVCANVGPEVGVAERQMTLVADGKSLSVRRYVPLSNASGTGDTIRVEPAGGTKAQRARLSIIHEASKGKVLVVPLSAVRLGADGQPTLDVIEGGLISPTRVNLGMSAQGLIEVQGTGLSSQTVVRIFEEEPDASLLQGDGG